MLFFDKVTNYYSIIKMKFLMTKIINNPNAGNLPQGGMDNYDSSTKFSVSSSLRVANTSVCVGGKNVSCTYARLR